MAIGRAPEPFLRVTVGSPVYSHDEHKIGVVKEIRRDSLKVSAGLLRHFWLKADAVAGAIPEVSVILVADKGDLDDYKVKQP